MPLLLDTSAWVELFGGGANARKVEQLLESGECHTCISTVAEIAKWALKENKDGPGIIDFIERSSKIINLERSTAALAGELCFQRKKLVSKWGMLDSFILSVAMVYRLTIITKDLDFMGLPNVEVL